MRRRKRKRVPVGERQPLQRPSAANEEWSMGSRVSSLREADTHLSRGMYGVGSQG